MKIIISMDYMMNLFTGEKMTKGHLESYASDLIKKNYKFYISALTCLEISRRLKSDMVEKFQTQIELLCEDILPLNYVIQKHIKHLETVKFKNPVEYATGLYYGMDVILSEIPDMMKIYSISTEKVADAGLDD